MFNSLETLAINIYDVMSYVIWGIPTLPRSVVGEGTSRKIDFLHLMNTFSEWKHNFVYYHLKVSSYNAESHSEVRNS